MRKSSDSRARSATICIPIGKPALAPHGIEIAGSGEEDIRRLQRWWNGEKDRTLTYNVKTYYGVQPMHVVFERSTWHSAQHVRQLIHVLERFGIEPDGRLTPQELAGLPLPERLFE